MAAIFTLKDIDEAIAALNYRSETTQKAKLLNAIRNYYADEHFIVSLQSVATEELIKVIWETGDDRELIKSKRKNFSSVKSGINSDWKKLYPTGGNPLGFVINQNNIFDISEEAKNKALAGITDVLRDRGIDTASRLTEILAAVNELLDGATAVLKIEDAPEEISRLKNLMGGLAEKLGLDRPKRGDADEIRSGLIIQEAPVNFRTAESVTQEGHLTQEESPAGKDRTISKITAILEDREIDAASRIQSIKNAVRAILSEAISSAGTKLESAEADQIENIFGAIAAAKAPLRIATEETDEISGHPSSEEGAAQILEIKTETAAALQGNTDALALDKISTDARRDTKDYVTEKRGADEGDIQTLLAGDSAGLQAGIAGILQDEGIGAGSKAVKIISALKKLLDESSAGTVLNAEEISQIKNIFGELSEKLEAGFASESDLAGDWPRKVPFVEIIEETEAALEEQVVEVIEKEMTLPPDEIVVAEEISEVFSEADLEDLPPDTETETKATEEALAADEMVEIIEELSPEAPLEPTDEEAILPLDTAGYEIAGQDLAGIAAPGDASPPAKLETKEISKSGAEEIVTDALADYEEVLEIDEPVAEVAPELRTEAVDEPSTEITFEEAVDEEKILPEKTVTDDSALAAIDFLTADSTIAEEAIDAALKITPEAEMVEETAVGEIEEIIEEVPSAKEAEEHISEADKASDTAMDTELQSKAEFLEKLAEAAKALEKLGPDLTSDIYTEKEIKEKAKLLSAEFEHYLGVREKYYNQHIFIEGGNYLIGCSHREKDEFPQQMVNLREFYIGKFPVTNALFEIFVEKTGYITTAEKYGFGMVYVPRMRKVKNALTGKESFIWNRQIQYKKVSGANWYHPSGPDSTIHLKRTHPVVQVSLEDACAFAAWTGKRIPTESEWEAAARTFHGFIYPWGNTWQENACNLEKSLFGETSPVDHYAQFSNESGVADTLGNVLEWTLDLWKECNPGEIEDTYVAKGASWISDIPASLTDRQPVQKNLTSNILGFRCIAI